MTATDVQLVARPARAAAAPIPAPTLTWVQLRGGYARWAKPVLDFVASALLILVFAPIALVVAIGVLISVGRPIFYKQRRVGLDGKEFEIYKFRSMRQDRRAGNAGPPAGVPDRRVSHKSPSDPRLTPFGRFIRKTSLDELPQFWNVLRGEMSLIGPRPELVEIVQRYEPWQHRRHLVRPGITGLWQVSSRDQGPMHMNTAVDLCYVDRVAFSTDAVILAKTVVCVFQMNTF